MFSGKMQGMRNRYTIRLTDEERTHLENLIRSGSAPARVQTRARILLLSDCTRQDHRSDRQVAEALLVSAPTVLRIRRKFVLHGVESALYDKPRPGRAPKITGEVEAKLTLLACSNPPEGRSRWTLKLLADQLVELGLVDSISDVAIHKRLKKTRSSPGK
jgi:transposase